MSGVEWAVQLAVILLLGVTLPMAFPLMMSMQFDPVWFGIIVTILMEVGMITPPVGLNLFVLVTVAKRQVPLGTAATELARRVGAASGGRLSIEVLGAGESVDAFEVFDAVADGRAQMGHSAAYY